MSANSRLKTSKFIDETSRISFKFNNKTYYGFKGDTLASALLANDVHLVGRSFKYHRPRGIMTAGSEEPNAIVQINDGTALTEPNVRATEVEIYEGLEASSQNCWPSVNILNLF
jgi:sarcosine oxidase subunit alpha